ncbi:regulator of microtubule dynamics protein 1-like [Littorina saxatilis]|uniref:Regulator of microtubule dynamics protein 1 n=1 Tax=Littorina saxatilis TaxID=31220 RepID=A0AAN9BZI2_9CAEN
MFSALAQLTTSARNVRFVLRFVVSRRHSNRVLLARFCHHLNNQFAGRQQTLPKAYGWAWILMATPLVLNNHDSPKGPAINGHTINSNFSCNSDDINEIIKKSDALLKDYKYDELCTLLSAYKQVENAELLWRLAEANCARAKLEGEKGHDHRRRELMEEGFTFAQRALKLDENNSKCHSWYATMLHYTSEFHGYKTHFSNAFIIRDHFEKAIALDPKDAISLHSLGYWCFAFTNLPWYQKKILGVLFRSPPNTTYEQALEYFYKAEEVSPGFFSMNLVMAGRAHYHLHQYDKARDLFTRAVNVSPRSPDERQAHAKAAEMLKKLHHHHH